MRPYDHRNYHHPADDARAIIDVLRRANIASLCSHPETVAAMVDAHQALRAENEALRAELNRVHGESKRVMKTLIAGQAALQRERDEARAVVTAAKVAEHKVDQAMQGRGGALSAALWVLRDAIALYDKGPTE